MLDFSKNYFELFGLPLDYSVDTSALADSYRNLQRVVHPDRFASAPRGMVHRRHDKRLLDDIGRVVAEAGDGPVRLEDEPVAARPALQAPNTPAPLCNGRGFTFLNRPVLASHLTPNCDTQA